MKWCVCVKAFSLNGWLTAGTIRTSERLTGAAANSQKEAALSAGER